MEQLEKLKEKPVLTKEFLRDTLNNLLEKTFGESSKETKLIFAMPCGSLAVNVALEESDLDLIGVFLAPPESFLMTESKFFPRQVKSSSGDNQQKNNKEDMDVTILELGYVLQQLREGNSQSLDLLFFDGPIFFSTPEWESVRAKRKEVLGMELFSQYLKGASGMFQTSLKKNPKRIYNSLRKFGECLRMLKGEEPKVYLTGEERERLLNFRRSLLEAKDVKPFKQQVELVKKECFLFLQEKSKEMKNSDFEALEKALLSIRLDSLKQRLGLSDAPYRFMEMRKIVVLYHL